MVVQDASGYTGQTLAGTWRFKYVGVWATNGTAGWQPEYQVNETPLTSSQLAALNSGATSTNIAQIATNTSNISSNTNAIGSNTSAINGLTTRVGTAETDITNIKNEQTTQNTNIGNNTNAINALGTRMTNAEGNISAIPNNYVSYTNTQTLTDAQKAQARANIGAGNSSFDGSYINLVDKPILNTSNTTAQSTNASETIDGTINLHKVAKTGTASDLIGYSNLAQTSTVTNLASRVTTAEGDIDTIEGKIPNQASTSNQLADKAFVNSTVQTATANFRGSWNTWADVPSSESEYPTDYAGSTTPTTNDYMVVLDASGYNASNEGTWRFKYTGDWSTNGKSGWQPEYQINEEPLTAAQIAALNSGATTTNIGQIATNTTNITSLQNNKQDALSTAQLNAVNSGITSALVTQIGTNTTNISAKQDTITSSNKLDADLVDDATSTNKFVTDSDIATWNAKQNALTFDDSPTQNSANPVKSSGVYTALSGKQSSLNTSQLNAVNSGITSTLVTQIGTNKTNITSLSSSKQDVLTFDSTPTASSTNPVTSGGVYTTTNGLNTRLTTAESKIPTTASSTNQLADKDFVNSSINASAAYYITSNAQGDPFATKAALTGASTFYSGGSARVPTTNDYCIVLADESKQSTTGNNPTTRYSYQGNQWEYQYTINDTPLTAAQLAALNSGITSDLVTQIGTNTTNITSLQNNKQDNLTTAQLNAINSGITATKVTEFESKQDALSQTQQDAVNSGITSTLVTQIGTNTTNIAGKQDALTQTQLDAVNSGITSTKVNTYDLNSEILSSLAAEVNNDLPQKVTKTNTANQIYGTDSNGDQTTLTYGTSSTANYIVQRRSGGQITVPTTPSATTDATSKSYVDGLSSDLVKTLYIITNIGGFNQSVSVTASIPSGYKFLCWLQPATSGWIGSVYPEFAYSSTSNFFNASTNDASGSIRCCYLVIKDI